MSAGPSSPPHATPSASSPVHPDSISARNPVVSTTVEQVSRAKQQEDCSKCFEHVQEAYDKLSEIHFDNHQCKLVLKALKILGAHNARLRTKQRVVACKIVQRQITLEQLKALVSGSANSVAALSHLRHMPFTTLKITRAVDKSESIHWARGDTPISANGEVVVMAPDLGETEPPISVSEYGRSPDFKAVEYCRLLQVLADTRMTSARQRLMECCDEEQLDMEHVDPWCEHIAPLYNDSGFKPRAVDTLSGGVRASDICMLDPSQRPHLREGGVLKRKWAELKSLYGTCVAQYMNTGQGDPEAFPSYAEGRSYIMYSFCFLKRYPILEPLATRVLNEDAQREEGVNGGVAGYGFGGRVYKSSPKKRRTNLQDINVLGIDNLVDALHPVSDTVAKEIQAAERDKLRYEARDAHARSTSSTLDAIKKTKHMIAQGGNDDEKDVLQRY